MEDGETIGWASEDDEIPGSHLEKAGLSASSSELGISSSSKMKVAPAKKRKANCVPKLIGNKRKHLQKKLSAA